MYKYIYIKKKHPTRRYKTVQSQKPHEDNKETI